MLQSTSVLLMRPILSWSLQPTYASSADLLFQERCMYIYFLTLNFTSEKALCACCRGVRYSSYFICSPCYLPLQRVSRDWLHHWNSSSVQSCWMQSRCPLTCWVKYPAFCMWFLSSKATQGRATLKLLGGWSIFRDATSSLKPVMVHAFLWLNFCLASLCCILKFQNCCIILTALSPENTALLSCKRSD